MTNAIGSNPSLQTASAEFQSTITQKGSVSLNDRIQGFIHSVLNMRNRALSSALGLFSHAFSSVKDGAKACADKIRSCASKFKFFFAINPLLTGKSPNVKPYEGMEKNYYLNGPANSKSNNPVLSFFGREQPLLGDPRHNVF